MANSAAIRFKTSGNPDDNASEHSVEALPPYTEFSDGAVDAAAAPSSTLTRTPSGSTTKGAEAEADRRSAAEAESPTSSAAQPAFRPTVQLQIQTGGKRWLSFPFSCRAEPAIPVFSVAPDGKTVLGDDDYEGRPLYISLPPGRGSWSGSVRHLVRGDEYYAEAEKETPGPAPLATTTYRFGPGRPPTVLLGHPADPERVEAVEVASRSVVSRAVELRTSFGVFAWRYAGSKERKACVLGVGPDGGAAAAAPDSLLVFEHLVDEGDGDGDGSGSGGKKRAAQARRANARRVAQLVRNSEFRSPGTSVRTAGNGGRLMLDLGGFDEKLRERVQWLVVATALVMLKKEVDRRKAAQIAILAGAAGGGGA